MDDEDMVKSNSDYLVTETSLDTKLPVDKVFAWLRNRKATGQVVFHLLQGGVQRASLVEKTRAIDGQREKVREILGV